MLNILILVFIILLFFLYKHFFTDPSTEKKLPLSPRKLPVIGNLHQIGRLTHRSLQTLSEHYGEIMLLHFGHKPVLVVSSANLASDIMKTQDIVFADRPQLSRFRRLLYNCKDIATAPYGNYWKHVRSICVHQLLSSKRVLSFGIIREEEVGFMIHEIEQTSGEINLSRIFVNFSKDLIGRTACGMKSKGEKDGIDFKELMEKHEELIGIDVGEFIPWLSWINYVNGVEFEIKRNVRDMDRCLEGIIQQHIDHQNDDKSGVKGNNDAKPKDLVDVLLGLRDDSANDSSLDQESIKAIILDMFIAGTTTIYATLEWTMSELLRNPKSMDSLTKEVRQFTSDDASVVTENNVQKMTYLKAVIKEALRLHPPVPLLLPRISMHDTKINGYDIPSQTLVLINAWAIHRDSTSWDEPNEFKPERFLDSSVDFKGQHFNLIPFGSGRRGCPGILFANSNIELALANIIYKFDWQLPDDVDGTGLDMMEHPGLAARRAIPLMALATPHFG